MDNTVLIRYGELGLKRGRTRTNFEKTLIQNMKAALKDGGIGGNFKKEWGRIFFETEQIEEACKKIARVFGVVSCSPAWRVEFKKIDEIVEASVKYAEGKVSKDKTFAIKSTRAGNHDFTSVDIAKKCGAAIVEKFGPKVKLKDPDVAIFVETRQKETYFFSDVIPGPGGLPLGVEGKVVCLVSGGIDSPVAVWLMMKRGCAPIFLNMDLRPFADDQNIERVKETLKVLKSWSHGFSPKTYFAPHGDTLTEFLKSAPRKITCLLCRRSMLKVAERIANKEKALAIVTGESLGQVASQTLTNINVEDQAVRIPVLRPLIGMDKEEIIELAKKIGTFGPSITPAQCCSAPPEHPETKAELDVVEDEERAVDIEKLIEDSVKNAVIEK
jgi:thiamine biosynthesis protein ThiI